MLKMMFLYRNQLLKYKCIGVETRPLQYPQPRGPRAIYRGIASRGPILLYRLKIN